MQTYIINQNDLLTILKSMGNISDDQCEKIAKELGKYLIDFRIRNTIPIIVEIPDKKGHQKDHIDYVSTLIKKAVGIEVNKET